MYKILRADRDTYITDRVIKNERRHRANVGDAGSLDLFKLYGVTSTGSVPNLELSRLLIHYDLDPLRDLISENKIDISHSSFKAYLKLFDVYGGQPTPKNYTVNVYPLSKSFDEGDGRDVVFYSDIDLCNFFTSSIASGTWIVSGCGLGGGIPGVVDYITASTSIGGGASLLKTQLFSEGDEDLNVDVTTIVSGTLAGILPDSGFRISFADAIETNTKTYFVKRFGARNAFNPAKRPQLVVKFNDSIQDDSLRLTFGSTNTLFLYNYSNGNLANIQSGSTATAITGSNSLKLQLKTEVSGGWYTLTFSGSQHTLGTNSVVGVYSSSFTLPETDATLASKLATSGSVKFVPIWGSNDGTIGYHTGSVVIGRRPTRTSTTHAVKNYTVTVEDVKEVYSTTDKQTLRVHIFDVTQPHYMFTKLPIQNPGIVLREVHYQIRNPITNEVEIPFDTTDGSTRLSSDGSGMFFELDAASVTQDRTYVIDIMVVVAGSRQVHKNASAPFRVTQTE